MQEEEGPRPSDELAEPLSVRLPPSLGSSAGNGFDEISLERQSVSPAGNRWPRQETMALLKIRSDMDPLFQEATLKAPLWEELSRKLTEEGYQRSAKKCKEKFENVFKYYKRTKEARAGKSYRFFSQLEALRSSSSAAAAAPALPTLMASSSAGMLNIEASSSEAAAPSQQATLFSAAVQPPTPAAAAGLITATEISHPPTDAADGPSSSSNSSSYSGTESEDEEEGEASRKRKRKFRDGGGGRHGDEAPENSGKLMDFFEGLIQKVMDQQEKMLQRFLEAIERREQNRMIREEAWRRQEKSRVSREHELAAQERAAAASRDDAIISFLQKLTGQKIRIPPSPLPPQTTIDPAEQTPTSPPPPPPPQISDQTPKETTLASSSRATTQPISSSRWPKSEVHALINLRSGMESRYQESTPKGPLWEEISAGMASLGYNRSAKRCKEKWENINKYFKKVKESNKNRPEDAKTCPYFHQLEALYRNKLLCGAGTAVQVLSTDDQLALISPTTATTKQQDDRLTLFEQGSSSVSPVKKPEDIVKKKMMEQAILVPGSEKQERGISSFQVGVVYMMPRVVGAGSGLNNLLAMVRWVYNQFIFIYPSLHSSS